MSRFSRSLHQGQKGFTLIEILIVIVLLGVLAATITPNLARFIGKGVVETANAELATVRTAITGYQANHNASFPCAVQPSDGVTQSVDNALIVPDYITGSVKATYIIDSTGKVVDADNGTWPETIYFNTTDLTWKKSE